MVKGAQPETFSSTDHAAVAHTNAMLASHPWDNDDIAAAAAIAFSKLAAGAVKMVIGTYTGDGTDEREIDIGGEAKFGQVLGANAVPADQLWFLLKGAETKFTHPNLMMGSDASYVRDDESHRLKSSTNGFTLSGTGSQNSNVNGTVYYYVMFLAAS